MKPRFCFETSDDRATRYVSQSIAKKWATYRLKLWNEFYDPSASRNELIEHILVGIQQDQWATYVEYRLNPKTIEKCRKNIENQAKQTIPHTSGSKSNARRIEEMFTEMEEKPGRGRIYLEKCKKWDGSYIDSAKKKCKQIKEVLTQSPRDKYVISPHDTVGKILEVEHTGRVRCFGLGAVPGSSFKKTRLHLDGTPNPTPTTSSCSSQCQQKITRIEDHCNSLMTALKSYMILKDGHIPEELVGLFSLPSST